MSGIQGIYFFRFKPHSEVIEREVRRLVRANPILVSHIPEALQYLITADSIVNDYPEVVLDLPALFYTCERK